MKVEIVYFSILERLAGKPCEEILLPDGARIEDAVQAACAAHGEDLRRALLGEGRRYMGTFLRNGQVANADTPLADGDRVTFLMPLSGG
ncbi:MAG: MoaD/ThiS family protein [Firmicutes bacterium]|nr:MoaD/ThiS family protein [Bacillota bacterium]